MPSTTKVPLKYLFHVQYYDGGGFIQEPEDVSKVDSKRSAYYDVEQDKVQYFELLLDDERVLGIDLATGQFFTCAEGYYLTQFTIGDPGPKPYKLIFYRQHTHNFNVGLDELSHEVKYCIGYTDADGVEHKILID